MLAMRASGPGLRIGSAALTAGSRLRSTTTTTTATTTSPTTPPPSDRLSWDEFLRMRRNRRICGLVSSIPTALAGTFLGITYFASHEIDPSQKLFGLDLFMIYGVATVGCGLAGWVVGPPLGTTFWRLWNRRALDLFERKQTDFLHHIRRNRVDPSYQSFNNPVPDYYGEKITSLKDYRRWLRDQRVYRRKASNFV